MIEKSEEERFCNLIRVNKLDTELSNFETKMFKLKMKKAELFKESNHDEDLIKKLESEKKKLEGCIEKELKRAKKKGNSIEANIQDIEGKLTENVKSIENLPNEVFFITFSPTSRTQQTVT